MSQTTMERLPVKPRTVVLFDVIDSEGTVVYGPTGAAQAQGYRSVRNDVAGYERYQLVSRTWTCND